MNRKSEDNIAKLAFGELSDAEASDVLRNVGGNDEASSALIAFKEMRADLQLLRDVPPDQLSKQRLQDAILGQGLKPERNAGSWNWIWAPVATAVFAFVLTSVLRQAPSQDPIVAVNETTPADQFAMFSERFDLNDRDIDFSPRPEIVSGDAVVRVANKNRRGGSRAGLAPTSSSVSLEGPVILIEPERDAGTGAQRAVEVDSYEDVLVSS